MFFIFGRKDCAKLKKEYKKIKKERDSLYSFYQRFYYGNPATMREAIKRGIMHNQDNIRNFNYKDKKYHTRKYVCIDGQKVRSKVEREIYNYLILNGVKVRYEAIYKTPWGSIIRPDFYLPEYQIYIEYFGKEIGEDKKYDEIMKFKNGLYSTSAVPFVILHRHDEENLYLNIKNKLGKFIDVSGWI
ncbi:MAG: hypothetical protein GXO25_01225 [Euryarchaeota archaeon]|nr:hypothetical protein [Euryarchaeota archaeon]